MTTLHVTDANTGNIVAIDTENPSGTLFVVDANTGNRVSINLSSPTGNVNVIDADTGDIVSLDLANLTGIITVVDANTGDFFDVDLDNPSGLFYTRDEDTGDLVQIDLSVDTFFKAGNLVIPQLGEKVAPTLAITLSQYTFKIGDTATVTFTFSEEVMNFTTVDITAPNGSLSSFTVTANPLIYTAIFTPTNGVTDATNVITVGTGWTDLAGNAPASSTNSSNYTVDTTAPTVTITSTASTITAGAFSVTITFSEAVVGFDASKITVTNGSAGAASGTGPYTSTITPTATGTVTVQVAAGAITDAAGNQNTASNVFSILYIATALWLKADAGTYQDSAKTTPATADADRVGAWADQSGNGRDVLQATAGNRATLKLNIKNGLPVIRFRASSANENLKANTFTLNQDYTVFFVHVVTAFNANTTMLDGNVLNSGRVYSGSLAGLRKMYAGAFGPTLAIAEGAWSVSEFYFAGASSRATHNANADVTGNPSTTNPAGFWLGNSTDGAAAMDVAEVIVFAGALSIGNRVLVRNYLNSRWAVF